MESMKTVYLFDPKPLSYRINNYGFFFDEFRKHGFDLNILYDKNKTTIESDNFIGIEYSFVSFLKLFTKEKPDVSIFRIGLKVKWSLVFMVVNWLFLSNKILVWSKGINITNIDQPLKNQLYYLRQYLADGLILYSEFEKQFIKPSLKKAFVANNTINQYIYEIEENDSELKKIKKSLNITQPKVALFVGRIEERKKVDLLIQSFYEDISEHALIIVGPGLTKSMEKLINETDNIYYLGPIYDMNELSKIYSISDIFCIPGHIGLGLNEAFLYSLPVVTESLENKPSLISSEPIMLFKDGYNGLYYSGTKDDLSKKLNKLFQDDRKRHEFGVNARSTFNEKAKIEYMRDGFLKSIEYVLTNDR